MPDKGETPDHRNLRHRLGRRGRSSSGRSSTSNTRTKARKAQKAGVRSRVSNDIRDPDIEAFFSLYAALAKRVGLDTPDRAVIEKMIEQGDLIGVSAVAPDGAVNTVNLIYLCPPYAFDLYGASGENMATGAGQFVPCLSG